MPISVGSPLQTVEPRSAWERAFRRLLANSAFAPGRDDYYAVRLVEINEHAVIVTVGITFLAAERYCCFEPGCHFGLWRQRATWSRLRAALENEGLTRLPTLTLALHVTVESGARQGLRAPGDRTSRLMTDDGHSYRAGPYEERDAVEPAG